MADNKTTRKWKEALADEKEIFTAKELFDLIQFNAQGKFEQSLKDKLAETNVPEDIELAMELAACIATINEFMFQDRPMLQFHTCKEGGVAYYFSPHNNPQMYYGITVRDLKKDLEGVVQQEGRSLIVGDNGKFVNPSRRFSKEMYFLQVAVHEVRHRVQELPDFKLFAPQHAATEGQPLKKLIKFQDTFFQKQEKRLRERGVDEPTISKRLSPIEFDAEVVDAFAKNKIYHGITLQEFFSLASLMPD